MSSEYVIEMSHIDKQFGGVYALKDVSLLLKKGTVLALLGENGAGKSTLMKILTGVITKDGGTVKMNGEEINPRNYAEAQDMGIAYVPQELALVDYFTVAENIYLGREPYIKGTKLVDFRKMYADASELLEKLKIKLEPKTKVKDLSVSGQQMLVIARILSQDAEVIIMDEPTAVLTPQETEELFEQLILLRNSGHSIIFISHKLEEVKRICTRVTVLRHGYCLGSYDFKDISEADISRLMVGRDVVLKIEKEDPTVGKTVLKIRNLVKNSASGKRVLDDVSFDIHGGEVIGIAGVEGNGQSALSDVLAGMESFSSGTVELNGHDIKGKNVHEIRQMGLAYIPEDRMQYGCAGDMSIRDNIIADRYFKKEYRNGLFINHKHIDEIVDQYIKDFEIACDDKREPVRMLSGGNIQKVVVAREFTSGSNFILANQPTRGIDVGAAEMIRKTIVKKSREEGTATLLISADLNEVLECSDRLLVMRKGKVVAAFRKANEVSEEELGEYMLGLKTMTPEEMEGLL